MPQERVHVMSVAKLARRVAPLLAVVAVTGLAFGLHSAPPSEHPTKSNAADRLTTSAFRATGDTGTSTAPGQPAPTTAIPAFPTGLRDLLAGSAPTGFQDVTAQAKTTGAVDANEMVFGGPGGQVQVYESVVSGGASLPPGSSGQRDVLSTGGTLIAAGNSMRLVHGDYDVLLIAQPVTGSSAFGISSSQASAWLSTLDKSL